MSDPRDVRLAQIVTNYSCRVKPGELVAIYGSPAAEPLIRELTAAVLQAGGHPYPIMGYEVFPSYRGFDDVFLREANEEQLKHVSRLDDLIYREFDAMINIRSARNTRLLTQADPDKQQIRGKAYTELVQTYIERGAKDELKWNVTLYPTNAQAQDAEMSLREFADFAYGACYADEEDPVSIWQGIHEQQQVYVDWLKGKKRVEVRSANAELKLSIEGRTFINSSGQKNMPSGEIFTGPVEDSMEGWVRFSYPAARYGNFVNGIEFEFERGRIVKATASHNEAFLLTMLDLDEGSRYLGEWAIGTNERINRYTNNILFDEKIGGSIHMAIGMGYPDTGSVNKSGIHWDMITDMGDDGEILVDGEVIYRGGKFLIGN